ncbi:MAG: tetratricopeptide repeat protein [Thaumarchaeota archaeon S15]|nr:MAG: tetratricopeptide repeat protein [Thaumarchaeota archaeon S15]
MGEYEDMANAVLAARPEITRSTLESLVGKKVNSVGADCLTNEGAIRLVASDLGVILQDKDGKEASGNGGDVREHVRCGDELCERGLFEEALAAYDRAAVLDPGNAGVHHSRGTALAALGRHLEALDAHDHELESLPTQFPAHPDVARAQVGRGDALRSLGRSKDAISAYEAALGAIPASRSLDHNDDDDADYQRARRLPIFVQALHSCALARLELDDLEGAINDCEGAIERNPGHAPAHRALILALLSLPTGSDRRASDRLLAAADRAIGADPNHALAHVARGDAICALGCHAYALAEYDCAIELDPGNAVAHHSRGTALAALNRHGDALAALDRSLELDPALPGASLDRSRVLSALGRHEDALAACDGALAARPGVRVEHGRRVSDPAGPDSPQFHVARGLALSALGRHDEALLVFERAVKLDHDSGGARKFLAMTLARLGRHKDALEEFRRMDGSRDAHPAALRAVAEECCAEGNLDDALSAYDASVAFRDGDPAAFRAYAMTLQSLGHHEKALAAYDRAIELDPDYAMAHRDRASVLLSLNRRSDALAALDRAVELEPDDAECHACRAHALGALGLHAEAEDARRRAKVVTATPASDAIVGAEAEDTWRVSKNFGLV